MPSRQLPMRRGCSGVMCARPLRRQVGRSVEIRPWGVTPEQLIERVTTALRRLRPRLLRPRVACSTPCMDGWAHGLLAVGAGYGCGWRARPSCLINIDIWRRRPQVLVDFKRIHAASLLALPQCSSSAGACNPEVSEYSLLPDFVFCLGSDEVSAGLSHGAELFEALKQRVRSRRPL